MSATPSFQKVGECLYRNPSSGTYYGLIKIRGKQKKQSLKTKDLFEARRKLKDFKTDHEGIDPSAGKITLRQLADKYLLTIVHQAKSTRVGKEGVIKRIKEQWPGGVDRLIGKIKPSEASEFLSGYPGASRHRQALEVLRCMFAIARKDGMIARSPVEGMKQRKPLKPIRPTPTYQEFGKIVQSIRDQKLADTADESADFVEFLGLAGLGQAEASALTWADVNFSKKQLITFRQKTRTGFQIPIYPQLEPLLAKRYRLATAANAGKAPRPMQKVFSVANAKKSMASACERLGLRNYSPRSLRRMFITSAIEKGIDVKVIASWQGHQDGGKLILDTYSHVRHGHDDAMAEKMRLD